MRRSHRSAPVLLLLVAAGAWFPAQASQDAPPPATVQDLSGVHGFDFLAGTWTVHSRKLVHPLTGSDRWETFEGTIRSIRLNDWSNVDATEFDMPEGVYPGVAPRAYDAKTGLWAIWWIDGRNPHGPVDPPVKGRFIDGVGTFLADDTLGGKPIKVRFVWSHISTDSAQWEQAYSADGGKTWEVNWQQQLRRVQ